MSDHDSSRVREFGGLSGPSTGCPCPQRCDVAPCQPLLGHNVSRQGTVLDQGIGVQACMASTMVALLSQSLLPSGAGADHK